jgi:hypothetical protein
MHGLIRLLGRQPERAELQDGRYNHNSESGEPPPCSVCLTFFTPLKDSSGWWLAHHEGRSGFVPKNYLELIVPAALPGAIVAGTAPPATVATANGSGAP